MRDRPQPGNEEKANAFAAYGLQRNSETGGCEKRIRNLRFSDRSPSLGAGSKTEYDAKSGESQRWDSRCHSSDAGTLKYMDVFSILFAAAYYFCDGVRLSCTKKHVWPMVKIAYE